MKKLIPLLIVIALSASTVEGQQTLTLGECYKRAESGYPLTRQRRLVEQARSYSIENAAKGMLPAVSVGAHATYQSEVTEIPVDLPGVERMDKDQYRVFAEVAQTIYAGGVVSARRQLAEANAEAEAMQLESDLYQLKNRINELFFGILLTEDQLGLVALAKQDLHAGLRVVEAAIANGTALRSASDAIRAEILRLDQRITELESTNRSYREMLGLFVNQTIERATVLEKPVFQTLQAEIDRPESKWFEAERQVLRMNEHVLSATRRPKVELFVQAGYGKPGLNMLENAFGPYYLGGIRFNWSLSAFYTFRNDKQILELRRQVVDVRDETFLFNTRVQLTQYDAEIQRLQELLRADEEIISLRTRVRESAEAQLKAGVITSADLIREVNAEDQAKQNRALHQTQFLLAQARHHFTSGQ